MNVYALLSAIALVPHEPRAAEDASGPRVCGGGSTHAVAGWPAAAPCARDPCRPPSPLIWHLPVRGLLALILDFAVLRVGKAATPEVRRCGLPPRRLVVRVSIGIRAALTSVCGGDARMTHEAPGGA